MQLKWDFNRLHVKESQKRKSVEWDFNRLHVKGRSEKINMA